MGVLLGCDARAPERVELGLTLALADTAACRPPVDVTSLRFEALGLFPPTIGGTVVTLSPDPGGAIVPDFPPDTLAFVVEAEAGAWRGAGVAFRPAGGQATVLLLPLELACPSVDPELHASASAAVAALPDGAVLIAGGSEGSMGSRRVLVRLAGEAFATIVPEGLSARREGVTATVIGDRVILAGGGLGPTGPALDSFEIYDHLRRSMDRESAGILASPRREHGAARLPDGRVLLVGGVAEAGGPPLDSAEIVDPDVAAAYPVGALPAARRAPAVVALDDGTVLVLGGYGALGSPYSTSSVFVFDPASETFEQVAGIALPPFARFRAVPLPGARVAFVGDSRVGLSSARIDVLRRVPPDDAAVVLEESIVDLEGAMPELTGIEAAATLGGRLVIAGLDPSASPRAYAVDVGLGQVVELPPLGAPTHLVSLADDTLLALDDAGGTLLRSGEATPYDNPPVVLVEDELAFDAPERWSVSERIRFEAQVDGARFDLAPLRFDGFAVDAFEVEGASAELLLIPSGGAIHAVHVYPESVGLSLCETERIMGAPLALERDGDRLTFSAGGAERTCKVEGLTGEVAIAVRASAGAIVRAPELRRVTSQ